MISSSSSMVITSSDSMLRLFCHQLKLAPEVTNQTKLIVLARPSNPLGEIYSPDLITSILRLAKQKNILVLVDEIFFELIFDKRSVKEIDIIASELNTLQNLIIVKGYSKNKNLAAFRIGYILSKNLEILYGVEKISEQRQCFAGAQNYTGLICLDAYIQSVTTLVRNNMKLAIAVRLVKQKLSYIPLINNKTSDELTNMYIEYQNYLNEKLNFYSSNYNLVLDLLGNEIERTAPKIAAFNTFVKFKGLDNINYFDFCFNMFITTGIESQIGPCFGLNQRSWQTNKGLGFWLRITYSRDKNMLKEGFNKFIAFKKLYLENQEKFLRTDLYF